MVKWHKENQTWNRNSHIEYNKRRNSRLEVKALGSSATRKWQRGNPNVFVPYNRAQSSMKRVSRDYPDQLRCELQDILPVYAESYRREQETGICHEVDHPLPLIAGGFHHPDNLEVITQIEHKERTKRLRKLTSKLLTEHYKK